LEPMRRQAEAIESQMAAIYSQYQARQFDAQAEVNAFHERYRSLDADPEVKSALRELNRGRSASLLFGLGPRGSLPDVAGRLRTGAVEILRSYGLVLSKGHLRYAPEVPRDVTRRIKAVVDAQRELGGGASPLERLIEQLKQVDDKLARTSSPSE